MSWKSFFDILKQMVFMWTILEVGLLAHLYYFACKKSNGSLVMKALFIFLTAVGINLLYRFFLGYAAFLGNIDVHRSFREFAIVPLAMLGVAARYFKIKSLDTKNLKKALKGGDVYGDKSGDK